jgi:hypothetical protein
MQVDPRRVAAIRVQLDALEHETRDHPDPEVHRAVDAARHALNNVHTVLHERALYLQIPDGYEPPTGLGGSGDKQRP